MTIYFRSPAVPWKPRLDWTPRTKAEVCACIASMTLNGELTPNDEREISEYLAFRQQRRSE